MVIVVHIVFAFLLVRCHTAFLLTLPNRIVHQVIAQRSAIQAVLAEGIDRVARYLDIHHRCLLTTGTQPIAIHQLMLA